MSIASSKVIMASNMSGSEDDCEVIILKQKKGRPKHEVWEYYDDIGMSSSGPHHIVECKMCSKQLQRSKINNMLKHVAKECKNASNYDRLKCIKLLSGSDPKCKNPLSLQENSQSSESSKALSIRSFYETETVSQQSKAIIDKELTKMIACTGIPMSIVCNPFFKSFINLLRPNYEIPSVTNLKEKNIVEEWASAKSKIESIISQCGPNSITIVVDSWTDIQHHQLYGFIIETSPPFRKSSLLNKRTS